MQTVIPLLVLTFVDDAIALAAGLIGVGRDLASGLFIAARWHTLAPVDRLARACDVADVIAGRTAKTRAWTHGVDRNGRSAAKRSSRLNIFAAFHGLRELT